MNYLHSETGRGQRSSGTFRRSARCRQPKGIQREDGSVAAVRVRTWVTRVIKTHGAVALRSCGYHGGEWLRYTIILCVCARTQGTGRVGGTRRVSNESNYPVCACAYIKTAREEVWNEGGVHLFETQVSICRHLHSQPFTDFYGSTCFPQVNKYCTYVQFLARASRMSA